MAALVLLYTKCEWFRDAVNAVVQKIVSFFTDTIPQAWSTLMDFLSGVPEWWSGIWQQVSDFFMQIWNGIVNFFTVTIPQAWNSVVTFLQEFRRGGPVSGSRYQISLQISGRQ